MKTLKFVMVCFLLMFVASAPAFSQTWITANQFTFSWDPVTTLNNGDPVPADNVVSYEACIVDATNDPEKQNPSFFPETQATSQTVTLTDEGQFFLGVRAIRTVPSCSNKFKSEINWSDNPEATNGNPFGSLFYRQAMAPGNLRPNTE